MRRRAFLALAACGPGAGCLGDFESEEIRDPDLVIARSDLVRENPGTEDERVSVWGVVRNESDREYDLVEIEATFLDGDGEELDTIIENVRDVTTGREWEFEVEYPRFGEAAAAVEEYELEIVTGV